HARYDQPGGAQQPELPLWVHGCLQAELGCVRSAAAVWPKTELFANCNWKLLSLLGAYGFAAVSFLRVIGTNRTGNATCFSTLAPRFRRMESSWSPAEPTGMIIRPPSLSWSTS